MNTLRHFLGWYIIVLAETLAAFAHHLCHAGAWLMDINMDEDCAQCRAHEDNSDPTDGPWAI